VSRSLLREFIHDHAAALLLFALVMVAACPVRCAEAQEMSRVSSVETTRGPVCTADSALADALALSWFRSHSGYVPGQIYAPPVQGSTSTATSTATSTTTFVEWVQPPTKVDYRGYVPFFVQPSVILATVHPDGEIEYPQRPAPPRPMFWPFLAGASCACLAIGGTLAWRKRLQAAHVTPWRCRICGKHGVSERSLAGEEVEHLLVSGCTGDLVENWPRLEN